MCPAGRIKRHLCRPCRGRYIPLGTVNETVSTRRNRVPSTVCRFIPVRAHITGCLPLLSVRGHWRRCSQGQHCWWTPAPLPSLRRKASFLFFCPISLEDKDTMQDWHRSTISTRHAPSLQSSHLHARRTHPDEDQFSQSLSTTIIIGSDLGLASKLITSQESRSLFYLSKQTCFHLVINKTVVLIKKLAGQIKWFTP